LRGLIQEFIRPQYLLIILSLIFASCGGQPAPSSNPARVAAGLNVGTLDLLAVDFIDAQTGWAVGDIDPRGVGGAIYQTLDGGLNWRPIAHTNEILTCLSLLIESIPRTEPKEAPLFRRPKEEHLNDGSSFEHALD
jgi:hypothetical protein